MADSGTIYESNDNFISLLTDQKSVYSYLQYHWWPMTFKDMCPTSDLSRLYKMLRDGKATTISTAAGITVQRASKTWPSIKPRLKNWAPQNTPIKTITPEIIKISTSIK